MTPASLPPLSPRLWVYTNYDCNLNCSYCVAESHPRAARRPIGLPTVQRIVDEAAALGFESIYFTGGEPFILDDITAMLAYASTRMQATVLTNAMLFSRRRLRRLAEINNECLTIQVSLDGGQPQHHDPYRGPGTWQKTVQGIRLLLEAGFRVRLATTETPANTHHLAEMRAFRRDLGISDSDHLIRPLAKRGFSQAGMQVGKHNLAPEMTLSAQGIYWHPLSTDPDLLVRAEIFPLAQAVTLIKAELECLPVTPTAAREEFQ